MAIQRKVGTSLNNARQAKLDELVAAEPFASPSAVLAAALDLMHAAWLRAGRDLKSALGTNGLTGQPVGGAA